ncbi:DUF1540 domain-containing protein [Alteribacter natronophilus]|uniref:DUF1540 domain-containing protein n=1 Tax=Alteribacter natronophilus TaxID=2583810 RepID=UPI00110DE90E|nr:DUF1540 domain-containing protein [Alteribacter natronophilus]TMW72868.1 DUF1540 domain-containing protein [Alteribacter natronophilus]
MVHDVLCDVENCVWNRKGRKCGATEIFVSSRKGKKASDHHETDCQTFKPIQDA